eukprot:327081_1
MSILLPIITVLSVCAHAHFDLLRFDEFEFKFNALNTNHKKHRNLIFDGSNDPFRCTDVPIISKQLCFRWDTNNGFEYGYDNNGILDDIISMNDDTKWHEINTLSNNENTKQCRYSLGMQECVHYSPSNAVTLKLKIGTNREPHNIFNFDNILPANMFDMNDNNGLNIDQFIFGNNAFNTNPFMPLFTNNHDTAHQFVFGDAMGFDRWGADIMNWKDFRCDICDDMNIMNDNTQFSSYGDYTYLFNEHEMNITNKMECGSIIPGLAHKICVTNNNEIYFKKQYDKYVDYTLNKQLHNEFDGVVLNFNNDSVWNDITTVHDEIQSIRKCKTFQMIQFCVTDGNDGYLKVNVKVGTHKLHRINSNLFNWNYDGYLDDFDGGYNQYTYDFDDEIMDSDGNDGYL